MLARDIIQPSVSPWSSPIVIVKKKSGEDRFCLEYRRLNSLTKRDEYNLPRIDEILDALDNACFVSLISTPLIGKFHCTQTAEKRQLSQVYLDFTNLRF